MINIILAFMILGFILIFAIPVGLLLFGFGSWVISKLFFEGFATKREKAEAIQQWFDTNRDSASYEKYRTDIIKSDVVEYAAAKELVDGGKSGRSLADHIELVI